MEKLTLETLPEAVTSLTKDIGEIKQLLLKKGNEQQTDKDELLTVQDAAKFLTLSVPTIYSLISKGELPVMKRSKRCYFSKKELLEYIRVGRRKTNTEIQAEAETYLLKKKGGNNE